MGALVMFGLVSVIAIVGVIYSNRADKKRTFISKVENDGENITLKTLSGVVGRGLGGKLKIDIVI